MNIAVCDENPEDGEGLIALVRKYFCERNLFVNVFVFYSGTELICEVEDSASFDVIFLSVERNGEVGIDTAYSLRMSGFRRELVLVSSTADFAIDGYEVGAAGYLPKPCSAVMFGKIMDRISGNFSVDTYLIKHRRSIIKVPLNEIIYVESNNSKCTVHTSSGDNYTLYKHLDDIESELGDRRFLRCHRSFIVNMNCVAAVDNDFVLDSGERILIRQKSRREIKDIFWEFVSHSK